MRPSSHRGQSSTRRFRATIRKQVLNSYVDVPEAVSRAFGAYARSGRISVEGTLDSVGIRGTLVPVKGGRHRLYVNGGMRSAAGVEVGDTVTLALSATPPGIVRTPDDLAAALRRTAGARAAFDDLAPSHRRELLRYIDDARTPDARQRRIQKTADHVLGKRAPSERRGGKRALWTCPRCGNEFVNRNQYHACKRYRLEDCFAHKPARIRELFERFRAMVEACGPVKALPYRDKVAFMVRVRFAGAIPKKDALEIAFWLPRRAESPRFRKIETIYPNAHVHAMRITDPRELDHEVAAWLREAYAIGRQEHLAG